MEAPKNRWISTMPKVLIIDDELQIQRLLRITLKAENYVVRQAYDGRAGLIEMAAFRPDLVILDLGLPDLPGIEVLKRLREWSGVHVLVLSVRSDQSEKIAVLDSGADDYVTKPFDTFELMARLRVFSRRQSSAIEDVVVCFGTVQVDLNAHLVKKEGKEVRLTAMEYALLHLLVTNRGKIMMHKNILRALWGPKFESHSNYLRVYMRRLRQKLENRPDQPVFLVTVAGFGYRLNDQGLSINGAATPDDSPSGPL